MTDPASAEAQHAPATVESLSRKVDTLAGRWDAYESITATQMGYLKWIAAGFGSVIVTLLLGIGTMVYNHGVSIERIDGYAKPQGQLDLKIATLGDKVEERTASLVGDESLAMKLATVSNKVDNLDSDLGKIEIDLTSTVEKHIRDATTATNNVVAESQTMLSKTQTLLSKVQAAIATLEPLDQPATRMSVNVILDEPIDPDTLRGSIQLSKLLPGGPSAYRVVAFDLLMPPRDGEPVVSAKLVDDTLTVTATNLGGQAKDLALAKLKSRVILATR